MNVKTEFTKYCGPSVLWVSDRREGHTLTIEYKIPALGEDVHKIVAHLRNGLQSVLLREVYRSADSARLHAYRATGHRDADMAQLLKGKLV